MFSVACFTEAHNNLASVGSMAMLSAQNATHLPGVSSPPAWLGFDAPLAPVPIPLGQIGDFSYESPSDSNNDANRHVLDEVLDTGELPRGCLYVDEHVRDKTIIPTNELILCRLLFLHRVFLSHCRADLPSIGTPSAPTVPGLECGSSTKRTYNPSVVRKKRRHGFLHRLSTTSGRRVLSRRRVKRRRYLSI